MVNILQYLQDTKGKPIPFMIKLLYNIPLNEDELIYNNTLNFYNSKITSLPNKLTVNGYLDLENSNITSLPNNLTVNGHLFIVNTKISELPDDLYVKGNLWCINTPLADKIINDISLLNYYSKQVKGEILYGKHLPIPI